MANASFNSCALINIGRLVQTSLYHSTDKIDFSIIRALLGFIEISVGVVITCVPTCGPLYKRFHLLSRLGGPRSPQLRTFHEAPPIPAEYLPLPPTPALTEIKGVVTIPY